MTKRGQKLASLTAAGVGALTLTSGAAKASIITVDVNTTYSYPNDDAPTSFHVYSHAVKNTALGPKFSVGLYQTVSTGGGFHRFANFYFPPKDFPPNSGKFVNQYFPRIQAGKTWNQVATASNTFARIGDRSWVGNSTTHGLPSGTNLYELFKFNAADGVNYGWIEYSTSVTKANSNAAVDGPNVTVVQYAWDNTGATIAAGQTAPAPEPGTFAMAALVLGAEGLRRWRKSRKQA